MRVPSSVTEPRQSVVPGGGRERGRPPESREVLRRHDGVGREAVHLRLVEQEEERAEPPDAVGRILAVEARAVPPLGAQLLEPLLRALAQLVQLPELDRVRGARLRARRLVAALEAVVAERALPDAAVLLLAEER